MRFDWARNEQQFEPYVGRVRWLGGGVIENIFFEPARSDDLPGLASPEKARSSSPLRQHGAERGVPPKVEICAVAAVVEYGTALGFSALLGANRKRVYSSSSLGNRPDCCRNRVKPSRFLSYRVMALEESENFRLNSKAQGGP